MKKLVRYFKCWNNWRKKSMNHPVSKFLVLIGVIKSPTFALDLSWDEAIYKQAIMEGFKNG